MYNVSNNYNQKALSNGRREQIRVIFNNNFTIDESDIIKATFTETVANSNITIGGTYSSVCSLTMRKQTGLAYSGSFFVISIGFDNEYVPLGKFFVADYKQVELEDTITITAYDKMAFMSDSYTSTVSLPATCQAIVNDIATQYGLSVTAQTYPQGNLITGTSYKVRDMLGYIAGLMGKNARINRDGLIDFIWYKENTRLFGDANGDGAIDSADISYINNNLINKVASEEYSSRLGKARVGKAILSADYHADAYFADVNEDHIVNATDVNFIQQYINTGIKPEGTNIGEPAIQQRITRDVQYMQGLSYETESTISITGLKCGDLQSGDGRLIMFTNPFMTQALLDSIKLSRCPFTYSTVSVKWRGNPSYEVGDIVGVVKEDNTTVSVPVMKQYYSFDGGFTSTVDSFGVSAEGEQAYKDTTITDIIETTVEPQIEALTEITETILGNNGINGGTLEFMVNSDGKRSGLKIWNQSQTDGWVWTYGGLAFVEGSSVQPTSIALTNDGKINASAITTGTLNATRVGAGSFTMTGGSINIDASTITDSIILHDGNDSYVNVSSGGIKVGAGGGSGTYVDIDSTSITINSAYGYLYCAGTLYENGRTLSSVYLKTASATEIFAPATTTTTANTALSLAQSKYGYGDNAYFSKVYISNAGSISGDANARIAVSSPYQIGYAGSSRRFKTDITTAIKEELNPHKLYDVDVVQFKFKDDWLDEKDERYGKDVIGLIAEDVREIMGDIYADLDEEGNAVDWDKRYIIPAMIKLIQEQHDEINNLKQRIEVLEND